MLITVGFWDFGFVGQLGIPMDLILQIFEKKDPELLPDLQNFSSLGSNFQFLLVVSLQLLKKSPTRQSRVGLASRGSTPIDRG